ncbi:uncharacterized protein LOC133299719 isoform X2 [Gastrolobium bilobum]|uniref:uncharacterized protein LOC133299719 isoform X2 n=1 Tax=Gastrolobium bilobum TaxID=150636 RepID=UPI002AB2EE9E|nr:uncharacterized protein LOC133299719 isoform X2 [Gastrolobium bilobum]
MDYDFRTRPPPYDPPATPPTYAPPPSYPKIGGPHGHSVARSSNHHRQTSAPSSSPGMGIRIFIKPEYRITPPPHLSSHSGDIPHSNFQFDFGLERKILAEANKENPNWSKFGMENLPTKVTESASPKVSVSDPIVSKYISMGLSREAVLIAIAKYGDNPTKEFVNGYTLLREMGFSSTSVAEALVMHDNDTDKALAHFLNG